MRHFAVIGLGRFGASVARTLAEKGQQVLAIDKDEEFVHEVMDHVAKAVCLDATDEKAAKSIGLHKVDVAVCGIGADLEASILVTLMLKELGVPIIVCKAVNQAHKKVLEKIGATRVVLPERDMGERIVESLISRSDTVLEHISLPGNSSIIEIMVPEEFVGKTLRELDMRNRYGVNVIAIKKKAREANGKEPGEEEFVNIAPQATDILDADDTIIVFGENDKIRILKQKNEA